MTGSVIPFFCFFLLISLVQIDGGSRGKAGKFLGLFQVVTFPNDPCAGTNRNGTCYTEAECSSRGGTKSGTCASGYGVCCIFIGSCGASFSENCTYFENAGGQPGSCSLEVCPSTDNICQLRLDFDMFVISGPSTLSDSVGVTLNGAPVTDITKGVAVATASQCLTDTFSISNPGGQNPPVICGSNNGEHVYVDAAEACNTMNFQLGTAGVGTPLANRQWSIKVTQYSCDFDNLAPTGCTQYFFGQDTGLVRTFNYVGGQHLANQDQSICVRREDNNCRICWTAIADTDFALSGPTNAALKKVTSSICCGYGTNGKGISGFDCLNIPGALNPANMMMAGNSRICGRDAGLVQKTGAAFNTKTVCSMTTPFNIRFLSDAFEFSGAAITEAAKADKGFQLIYLQSNTGC